MCYELTEVEKENNSTQSMICFPLYSIPPSEALKQILSSANRVTFYGFLMALAKNDLIYQSIGMFISSQKYELKITAFKLYSSEAILFAYFQ